MTDRPLGGNTLDKVELSDQTSYRCFRASWARGLYLRDESLDGPPTEKLLQKIWLHQRFKTGSLRTLDHKPVRVLHPGFWNHESGPDFLGAVVQIEDAHPVQGDVEIDLSLKGWRDHGHDCNPSFEGVVLRVVWVGGSPGSIPDVPCLGLAPGDLDSPLPVLAESLMGELDFPLQWSGECSSPLSQMPTSDVRSLLRDAALVRLENKSQRFQARARQVGWNEALFEGMMEALGYKHNGWPFRMLAERVLVRAEVFKGFDPTGMQAVLFGLSGFLTHEWRDAKYPPESSDYLKSLWDVWWRYRAELESEILPLKIWRLNGIRPANHPHRRIALAATWFCNPPWTPRLEEWMNHSFKPMKRVCVLLDILEPRPDPFWSRRFTLGSSPTPANLAWLGGSRVTDIGLNIVLPWFYARASMGSSNQLRERVLDIYLNWPKGESNSLLKLAMNRLMGRSPGFKPGKGFEQQGMLQVLKDYCYESNALCEGCPLPNWLKAHNKSRHRSKSVSEL